MVASAEHAEVILLSSFTFLRLEFAVRAELASVGFRLFRSFGGLAGVVGIRSGSGRRLLLLLLFTGLFVALLSAGGVRIGGLTTGVRGSGAGRGVPRALTGFFRFSLPITGVDTMRDKFNSVEIVDIGVVNHFVLDPTRQPVVELTPEGAIVPTGDCSVRVKTHKVSGDFIAVFHATGLEVVLSISDRVVRAKMK